MENYASILATLAKNNINLIHVDEESGILEFEFQWRCNRTTTKWTKSLVGIGREGLSVEHLEKLVPLVREIRSKLEA